METESEYFPEHLGNLATRCSSSEMPSRHLSSHPPVEQQINDEVNAAEGANHHSDAFTKSADHLNLFSSATQEAR